MNHRVLLLAAIAIATLAVDAWRWEERSPHPCPQYHFAITGDSNTSGWDFGPGCLNLGIGGSTSKQQAAKLTLPPGSHGTFIVWSTSNDIHTWSNFDARYERLMVDRAKAAGLHVVLTTPIPIHDKAALQTHTQAQISAAVNHLADSVRALGRQEGVPVADLNRALDDGHGLPRPEDYLDQGGTLEHLSPAGRRLAWGLLEPYVSH